MAHRLFAGPTGWEMMRDLRLVRNGSTGFTKLTLDADGIARIRLVGDCHLVDRPTTIGDPERRPASGRNGCGRWPVAV